jgi:hypothetical protein
VAIERKQVNRGCRMNIVISALGYGVIALGTRHAKAPTDYGWQPRSSGASFESVRHRLFAHDPVLEPRHQLETADISTREGELTLGAALE